jgi:hypothetical protein
LCNPVLNSINSSSYIAKGKKERNCDLIATWINRKRNQIPETIELGPSALSGIHSASENENVNFSDMAIHMGRMSRKRFSHVCGRGEAPANFIT